MDKIWNRKKDTKTKTCMKHCYEVFPVNNSRRGGSQCVVIHRIGAHESGGIGIKVKQRGKLIM